MPRPPIHQSAIDEILGIWYEDKRLTSKEVKNEYDRRYPVLYRDRYPYEISISKIEKLLREPKRKWRESGDAAFSKQLWAPWAKEETPENLSFLFDLHRYTLINLKRGIFEHEAVWARKLRAVLSDASIATAWRIVSTYSWREEFAEAVGEHERSTKDIDGFVAFKAWLPENESDYLDAVGTGLVLDFIYAISEREVMIVETKLSDPDSDPDKEYQQTLMYLNLDLDRGDSSTSVSRDEE